ncbi:NlpC/P60 family protein [Tsukamurella sp. 8F]|uniref:C40 family peptidase n=1 Tax=unclassified Tsukamurella TaxID=2633480 RepID=UPI0023B95491|nr:MULTISPECIES: NlpC/P60 family protein [unclassified Tsukamurella]MDF0528955.1 NlpC/P60 family protein [Tsukamurella sp. 8J]MDF0587328.1 NlpC/P60 family protein [Tsukamurella sp. 8F]
MSIVDALATPLYSILDSFGSGDVTAAGIDRAIATLREQLESVGDQTRSTNVTVGHAWAGVDAGAAQRSLGKAGTSAQAMGTHTGRLQTSLQTAAHVVEQGRTELRRVVDSFVQQGEAANPTLTNPAGLLAVLRLAAEHLQQALQVLEKTRQALDGETGVVAGLAQRTPSAPEAVDGTSGSAGAATAPASAGTSTAPTLAQGAGSALGAGGSGAGSGTGTGGSGASGLGSALSSVPDATGGAGSGRSSARPPSVNAQRVASHSILAGEGVEVRLPDGRVVRAPNEQAAAAVRAALTQLGVPYQWGGTSPGQGLDCSGLTQWAYRQAGIEIPRLAQEQHVGAQVSADSLLPGDLAVWDGHVAMVIGDGRMIEAGDPVQISSVRTDNVGMGFMGFFRPTEGPA